MNITFEGDYDEFEKKKKTRLNQKDENFKKFLSKWKSEISNYPEFEKKLLLKIKEIYL